MAGASNPFYNRRGCFDFDRLSVWGRCPAQLLDRSRPSFLIFGRSGRQGQDRGFSPKRFDSQLSNPPQRLGFPVGLANSG